MINLEALAEEMKDIDLRVVTREAVAQCVAYGVVKYMAPDKFIAMHLPIGKPVRFEVKTFVGDSVSLDTEDMQQAIAAYNRVGAGTVTREEIERHVVYGLVKLYGADKMFVTQMRLNQPPRYVVRDYSGERVLIDTEDMQAAITAYNQAPPRKEE